MSGWVRRPPGPVLAGATLIAGAVLLWAASLPGSDFGLAMYAVLAGFVLCAVWLVRTLCFLITTKRFSWWLLVVPAVVVLCLSLSAAQAPLRVRFALAENAFTRAADTAAADPQAADALAGDISGYPVSAVAVYRDRVYFTVAGGGFLDQSGFARLPSGPPAVDDPLGESVSVTALTGDWYVFSSTW
jgi:hypothetical protein